MGKSDRGGPGLSSAALQGMSAAGRGTGQRLTHATLALGTGKAAAWRLGSGTSGGGEHLARGELDSDGPAHHCPRREPGRMSCLRSPSCSQGEEHVRGHSTTVTPLSRTRRCASDFPALCRLRRPSFSDTFAPRRFKGS